MPHMRIHLLQSLYRTRRPQTRTVLVVDMNHGSAREIRMCLLDHSIPVMNPLRALWSMQIAMGSSPLQSVQRLNNHDA